jgi:hypothetical protein
MVNWFCRFEKLFSSTKSTSGSSSGPSTCESGVVAESEEQEELGDSKAHPLETVQEEEVANEELLLHEQNVEVEGIMVFNPDVHLVFDPALRVAIDQFHPDIRDDVRRAYLVKGPTKPYGHNFPKKPNDKRVFLKNWLKQYDWFEYSVAKDVAFCFYCFLFKQKPLETHFGHDASIKKGTEIEKSI